MDKSVNVGMIIEYMTENNLTKKEFSKQCKICTSTLNRIMHEQKFNLVSLLKLAEGMGMQLRQLLI